MKKFLQHNFRPLLIYFILLASALYFLFTYHKLSISLYINQFVGNKAIDDFFYYITYLGDGRLVSFILLIILLYNVRLGLCSTLSFLFSTLVATGLKYTLFDDENRPFYTYQYLLDKSHVINYVDGLDLHIHNSFPSGHSTQVFAIFMCLVFASKRQSVKLLWLSIAVLTAFSRVYLSQHWLTDIIGGSIIGLAFSLIFEYLIIYKNKFVNLNDSLVSLIKSARNTGK